jgi:hypothetical protein
MKVSIKTPLILVLTLCAFFCVTARVYSQTDVVKVDPGQTWQGYMNVSALPANGGAFQFGNPWATTALQADFIGNTQLMLLPCTNVWETTNTYYVQVDGITPNEIMDANMYIQNDALVNTNLAFTGSCLSNTLTAEPEPHTGVSYTTIAFIKIFDGSYDLIGEATSNLIAGQSFTVTLSTSGASHVQYGFETTGPDANPSTASSLGFVVLGATGATVPVPTNNAPIPTPTNTLAMYDSSGVYPESPVDDWLASWSSAAEAPFTIPNKTNVVLKYTALQYAGVEFYDPEQLDVTQYNTMHLDIWTPNANQFGVQLVSLDNGTQAAQVNFTPASGTIVSNKWVSLDIPLYKFTQANPTLDLANLQQLLWIDNQGGGVAGGTFYIDNVYFYSNSAAAPPPPPPAVPTNNAPIPTQPSGNVLAMYDSSGTYGTVEVIDWLASWSSAGGGNFTITNTGNVVLQYVNLQYAGVEFYNAADDQINASSYNTMHVDVWTPNANQFGVQLVSLDSGVGSGTQAGQVNITPASGEIVSNKWVSLDIPLSEFVAAQPTLDLTDLQQLLWIDNQAGGVNGGIFYVDNVYFYESTVASPVPMTATVTGKTVNLSFPAQSGFTYTIQYTTSLTNPSWQTLTTISGNNNVANYTDTANQTTRFYRWSAVQN